MAQYGFGAGVLVGTAQSDAAGNAIAAPTPIQFGIMQEASVDFSFDIKELFGQYQFPVAIGRGKGKIAGKSKFAQLNGLTINSLFFGQTLLSGEIGEVIDTTGTAIPATPFTITPTVPNSGTWTNDLGVLDPNGLPMTRVVSGPTAGQYSVSAGAYVFAAADTGKVVRISYQYTATSTTKKKLAISNVLMGYAPQFRADLLVPYGGKQFVLTLPACIGTKLSFATKLDDFMVPEFDFSAFADAAGNVAYLATSE
ncbi:hypothetical protein [Novosphingobium sp. EMRT-2]|uniref:hypothetical protein n=1 Tax=Novosphingobium sp. EMRT-2 TaxID=2571749 RepID=UPI00143D1DAD|nr:hypothetical protein [Novosphingobium sp. EMRT-2]